MVMHTLRVGLTRGWVQISHDPFARESLLRRIVVCFGPHRNCAWCGGHRPGGQTLFQYGVEPDDRPQQPLWDSKAFCSLDCRRSYYD